MSTEHSATYVSTMVINNAKQRKYTGKAFLNVTQAQTPGRWGSASLRLHVQITHVPVHRAAFAGQKGPGSKRNCVGGGKA